MRQGVLRKSVAPLDLGRSEPRTVAARDPAQDRAAVAVGTHRGFADRDCGKIDGRFMIRNRIRVMKRHFEGDW